MKVPVAWLAEKISKDFCQTKKDATGMRRGETALYQENISVLLSTTFWLQTCGVFLMLGYIFWTGFSKGYFFTIMYNVLYVGICKCIIVKSVNKSYSIAVGILYVCYISIRYTQSEIMYSTLYSSVHNIYEGQNYFNNVKTKIMYQTIRSTKYGPSLKSLPW